MTPTSLKEGKKKAVERGKEFYLRVESPVLQFDYPPSHLAPYFRAVFAQTDEEWCYGMVHQTHEPYERQAIAFGV